MRILKIVLSLSLSLPIPCMVGNNWFPGTITAAIPNEGTFDIAYDDGDTDEALSNDCVQRLYRYS